MKNGPNYIYIRSLVSSVLFELELEIVNNDIKLFARMPMWNKYLVLVLPIPI